MMNAKPLAAPAAASIAANDNRQAPRIEPPRIIAQPIPHGVGIALFIRGGGVSIGVFAATIAPQWQRICRLALSNIEALASVMWVRSPSAAPALSRDARQERALASRLAQSAHARKLRAVSARLFEHDYLKEAA